MSGCLWISPSVSSLSAVTAGLFRFASFPRLKFILRLPLTFCPLVRLIDEGLILGSRNLEGFMHTTTKLENALRICNEMFEDCPKWEALPELSKLRFAYAFMVAVREIKPSQNKA